MKTRAAGEGSGMSEPMTQTDIEDVLSSIRKLVSEDLRPVTPAPRLTLRQPEAGKLILTPALRVAEDAPEAASRAAAMPAEVPADVAPDVGPAPAAPEVEVPSVAEDVAPVLSDTLPEPRLDDVVASIAARVDDVMADPWESETGDATVTELPWVRPAFVAVPRAVPEAEAPAPAAEAEVAPERPPGMPPEMAAEPEAEAAAHDFASAEAEGPDEGPDLRALHEDAALDMDEDVLREIIREVLREELQGPLGERITRNIRKLVRAEINRSLNLRDLG